MRGKLGTLGLSLTAGALSAWLGMLIAGGASFGDEPEGRVLFEKGTAVFFQDDDEWAESEGSPGDAAGVEGLDLVATGLEKVSFEGKVYPLEREGLYRFVKFPSAVTNLIARRDENSLLPVLKGLSQLHIHGKKHDGLEDAVKKIKTMPWMIQTCGPARNLAYTVLRKQAGFWPRSIDTLTTEKLSGFDDGHSLLEVYDPARKKRILADIDMGLLFKKGDIFLDAYELRNVIREKGDYELVRLSSVEIDPEFSIALYGRLQTASPQRIKDWYRRVFQIVAIDGDALTWDEGSRKRVTDLWGASAIKGGEAEWVKRHYQPVE
jgi:hypothetical protein